jgi:ubiquinol-cytochrome c reductase cytochrome b subunit
MRDRYPVQMQDAGIEENPASSAWPQVLGGVALFAFLVQVATGILLSLHYTPAPGAAYGSVRQIMTQVMAGRLLRALHQWGASLMIMVVVLHLIWTFVSGAYRKPREATWIGGLILLLLTAAFGLTGYPLPWDNRAYWGTAAIIRLLGANETPIGVATFNRFYAAHVHVLPPLTALLIAWHVYLARRHSKAPVQWAKDTIAIFGWFAVLMGLATFARVPLGHMADPTDSSYVARPEWYFLFLFQVLRWFDGPLRVLRAVILPALAIVALLLVPFVDRGRMRTIRRRWGATGLAALAAIFWGALTVRAIATTPESHEIDMSLVESWQQISAGNLASIGFFRKAQCGSCHVPGNSGAGPDITLAPSSRPASWLEEHIQSSSKPPEELTGDQVKMLAAFTTQRSAQAVEAWQNAPQNAVEGALIYQDNDCGSCHN